jgi:hypothetical protein
MLFEELISNKKLKAQFETLDAGSVFVTSFAHNDNNESATSALASVRQLAAKTASATFICGDALPEYINKRANEKLAEAEELKQTQAEFEEKTSAVLKMQIAEMGGKMDGGFEQCASDAVATAAKIEAVGGSVATIGDSVATIGGDVATINGNVTAIGGNVAALGGDVATIRGSMTTFDCKIDKMYVSVHDKELLIAKVGSLEKQLKEVLFLRHSDSGRHANVVRNLNLAAEAAAKVAADAAAAAAKVAADRELALVAEMHRLTDEKNRYFHTAYWLDVDCKSKVEIIKSKDDIIYGLHRELRYNYSINAVLHREMATNNALEDLTNALKRRRPDAS